MLRFVARYFRSPKVTKWQKTCTTKDIGRAEQTWRSLGVACLALLSHSHPSLRGRCEIIVHLRPSGNHCQLVARPSHAVLATKDSSLRLNTVCFYTSEQSAVGLSAAA